MIAVPQAYIGSRCEVKSLSSEVLATGQVIHIDQNTLDVAADDNARMPPLQLRMPVKLLLSHANEGTRFLAGIVNLSAENLLRVEEIKPFQDFERHSAIRMNTNVVGCLRVLLSEEEQAAFDAARAAADPAQAQQMLRDASLEVRVLDIGLRGVRLYSSVPLNPGASYYIEFSLLDEPASLCLRVQRMIQMPGGEVQYGCTFFDFSEQQMDNLCRQLFRLQRLEHDDKRTV